jgi:hypothetical protein
MLSRVCSYLDMDEKPFPPKRSRPCLLVISLPMQKELTMMRVSITSPPFCFLFFSFFAALYYFDTGI